MFCGPSFIVNTMQEETTPIFKRLWDQQGLLMTYSLPGAPSGAPTPDPRGVREREAGREGGTELKHQRARGAGDRTK